MAAPSRLSQQVLPLKVSFTAARRRQGLALLSVSTMAYHTICAVLQWQLQHELMAALNLAGVVLTGLLGWWAWRRALPPEALGNWVMPLALMWLAATLALEWGQHEQQWVGTTTEVMVVVLGFALLSVRRAMLFTAGAFALLLAFSLQSSMPVLSIQRLVDVGFLNLLILGLTVFGQRIVEAEQVASTHALLAMRDPLTGLYNRRVMDFLLQQIEQGVLHPPDSTAVALIDIDHFKQVNDVYGHETGDAVLRALARVIHEHLREDELAIRWGGEELLAVYLRLTPQEARRRAEALRLRISHLNVPQAPCFTVSIGLGMLSEVETVGDLFGVVDARLYQAKALGRNRVVADG
ncbi:GGDEF domain-containing protein [Deinococcus cavernae]|uniref:GGDEF domain-containing protein n=1 Tax=Deinococcus cavernae TaxID=2320857 RepID=A0A418V9K2_9DEIO|nr:GGDEF domain-containing protein [Deinococcus cavernae]RJF72794.1 GGDEF domain-containing protein [Deinococcus cavernae]